MELVDWADVMAFGLAMRRNGGCSIAEMMSLLRAPTLPSHREMVYYVAAALREAYMAGAATTAEAVRQGYTAGLDAGRKELSEELAAWREVLAWLSKRTCHQLWVGVDGLLTLSWNNPDAYPGDSCEPIVARGSNLVMLAAALRRAWK